MFEGVQATSSSINSTFSPVRQRQDLDVAQSSQAVTTSDRVSLSTEALQRSVSAANSSEASTNATESPTRSEISSIAEAADSQRAADTFQTINQLEEQTQAFININA